MFGALSRMPCRKCQSFDGMRPAAGARARTPRSPIGLPQAQLNTCLHPGGFGGNVAIGRPEWEDRHDRRKQEDPGGPQRHPDRRLRQAVGAQRRHRHRGQPDQERRCTAAGRAARGSQDRGGDRRRRAVDHARPDRRPLPRLLRLSPDQGRGQRQGHDPAGILHAEIRAQRAEGAALRRHQHLGAGRHLVHRRRRARRHQARTDGRPAHVRRRPHGRHLWLHRGRRAVVGRHARSFHRQALQHRRRDGHRGAAAGQARRQFHQDGGQPRRRVADAGEGRDRRRRRRGAPPQPARRDPLARRGLDARRRRGRRRLDHPCRSRHRPRSRGGGQGRHADHPDRDLPGGRGGARPAGSAPSRCSSTSIA